MRKMKFNEGGQPVFLDDLKLLQDLCLEQMTAIVRSLTNEEVVLMSILVRRQAEVAQNAAFVDGIWVSVPKATASNPYLSVWRVADNERVLESGSSSACATRYYAQWTEGADSSATWSIKATSLQSVEGLISKNEFKELTGTWKNGFSGHVYVCRGEATTKIVVRAEASATVSSGSTDIFSADGYVPCFFLPIRTYNVMDKRISWLECQGNVITVSSDNAITAGVINEIIEVLTN